MRDFALQLGSDMDRGITDTSEESMMRRDAKYGNNIPDEIERSTFCQLFFGAMDDFVL